MIPFRNSGEQCDYIQTFHTSMHCDSNILYPILSKNSTEADVVDGMYFYHSDHLGSATWITNSEGRPIEYLHYMPYGELWVDQQASAYVERFRFTGKERDSESGYDYFGARYYSSTLPMWLSVDPLSDSYPDTSPYVYCGNNPIKFVDPDGREKHIFLSDKESYAARNFRDDNGIYVYAHGSQLGYLQNENGGNALARKVYVQEIKEYINTHSHQWKIDSDKGKESIVLLYACHAGEQGNIAQQLSERLNEHETIVVGPIGILTSSHDPRAPREARYRGVKSSKGQGLWSVYRNGQLETTIRGNTSPNKTTIKLKMVINQLSDSIKKIFSQENE